MRLMAQHGLQGAARMLQALADEIPQFEELGGAVQIKAFSMKAVSRSEGRPTGKIWQ